MNMGNLGQEEPRWDTRKQSNAAGIPRECARRNAPKEPTVNILEYREMEPFKSPDPTTLHSLADLSVFLVP
jgi:hypothetical protein